MNIYHLSFSGNHPIFLDGLNIAAKSMIKALKLFHLKYPDQIVQGIVLSDIPYKEFIGPIHINQYDQEKQESSKSEE